MQTLWMGKGCASTDEWSEVAFMSPPVTNVLSTPSIITVLFG